MGVGIPGVPERGVAMCVAVGLAGGDASRGMDVLGGITETHHQRALELLPLIEVQMGRYSHQFVCRNDAGK